MRLRAVARGLVQAKARRSCPGPDAVDPQGREGEPGDVSGPGSVGRPAKRFGSDFFAPSALTTRSIEYDAGTYDPSRAPVITENNCGLRGAPSSQRMHLNKL